MRAEVASPLYHGGVWDRTGAALVDPGKLALGLRAAAAALGVRITRGLRRARWSRTRRGSRSRPARRSAGPPRAAGDKRVPGLLPSMRRYNAPVYDYVLVTEPLSAEQLLSRSVGGGAQVPKPDAGNRVPLAGLPLTAAFLWGGYDAVYRFGGPVAPRFDVARTVSRDSPALLHELPAARGHAVLSSLGRRDRHLQPIRRVLRHRPPRARRLRDRLHRARRMRVSLRRPASPRPVWDGAAPTPPRCATCAASRSRSRPSHCGGR